MVQRLIEHKRGQFFIIVAIMFCVTLLLVATYVISVIGSPPWARVGGAQYTYTNVKAQSVRVVEVSLANLTNGGLPNILVLSLEDWKNSTESFCAQQGLSLALAYTNVWNGTSWNETLGWSKASVSFTLLLQSGATKIIDEYTVRTELYANITEYESFNATHLRVNVRVWKEGIAPVIGATVNVFAVNESAGVIASTQAVDNGDGTYTALVPSEVGGKATDGVYVSVLDSRSILVEASNVSGGVPPPPPPPPPSGAREAFVAYRSNTGTNLLNSPKGRSWNGSMWLSEDEMATAGSAVQHVRAAYCPIEARGYEKIVVTLSNDGYLDAYVWNGSSWLVTNTIGYVGTTVDVYRAYDITYEKSSGRAMLVYAISSSDASEDLAYKIWDGTQWSSDAYINDPSGSDIQYYWVHLASYPLLTGRVNEIALIASEETSDDCNAWIWDGNSWDNYLRLEGSLAIRTEECIAVEYEQQSGDAMFVWGDYYSSRGYMESRKWTGSWGSELSPDIDLGQQSRPNWLTLKADPSSNRLMVVSVDSSEDLNTILWDGSSWSSANEHDSNVDGDASRCADFEWEPNGSKGLLVWGTSSGSLSYKTFTAPSSWSDVSTITAAGTHPWVQLRRNTDADENVKILGATLNSNFNLGALTWNGSTLTNTGDSVITTDTNVYTYECFDIRFRNFAS